MYNVVYSTLYYYII